MSHDFATIPMKLLAQKGTTGYYWHFPNHIMENLRPCSCHLREPHDRAALYDKICNGQELSTTEDYALTGHIDEEWHSDTSEPAPIWVFTQREEAERKYASWSYIAVLIEYGKLFLVGCTDVGIQKP